MDNFTSPLSDSDLYSAHWKITSFLVVIWILVSFLGFKLNTKYKKNITIFLISVSFLQEIFDYINRFFLSELYVVKIQTDLPLQLCHFAYWFSVICLICQLYNYKNKQFYFNCAYFLGFSGAFQGLLTVDLTGIYTFGDMLSLHLQHSFIIMNVLWLIFAYRLTFNPKGIFQAFLFTNVLMVFVGIINLIIGSNYMFLCSPPLVDNPLLVGEWPYYLIVLEVIFFLYGYILCIPFWIIKYFKNNI